MLSLDELSKQIEACCSGRIDLESFEEWFQQRSWGSYDRPGDPLSDAIFLVRAALTSYDPEEIDEVALRVELANAIPPFVLLEHRFVIVRAPRGMTLDQGDSVGTTAPVVLGTNSPVAHSDLWEAPMLAAS